MDTPVYIPEYTNSWALIIGIDSYYNVSPLEFACNDAQAISELLIEKFGFPEENAILLTDEAATRSNIMEAFLDFASRTAPDDRVLVFFAGHGHTHTVRRGEVGFLVPVDGSPNRFSSLIRWDDLTRNAELIPAKHMFFVMDACYGGLAITRALSSGSMRFLRDMLQRFSRQVLTAGKADEVVSDSGGPIPGHSVFTGHLIQALEGAAATSEGIVTANGVMSYVYHKVAKDQYSQQTPHYGFIDGDGDFVFQASILDGIAEQPEETGSDILIEVPPTMVDKGESGHQGLTDLVKQYISDSRYRIKLDDLVTQEIRRALSLTTDDTFPVQGVDVTTEEFADRLARYESITRSLQAIIVLLAHWGGQDHIPVIRKIVTRMAEQRRSMNGSSVAWLNLRWYPATILMYSGGIGAIAGENYDNLSTLLLTPVHSEYEGSKKAVLRVVEALSELQRVFKLLPAHKRHYVPHSEYLFKMLQPEIDDLLFLGRSYEALFDRFEILLALICADLLEQKRGQVWGLPGRFAWKYQGRSPDSSPFIELAREAERQQDDWPPIRAGFFGASYQRFNEIASKYREEFLNKLSWF
jgi:hypothetical protein